MRDNGPVTNTERHFGEHERIISKTDLKGRIVYANRSFIDISGFTMDELRGKAHNMVRHPEMPEAAFEDLWSTLKAGKSWRGMVKNRCKNGDYYWVEANVSPVLEGGSITGYVSLRTRPTREQVDAAENIYRLMREGRANHLRISEGRILRRGPMRIIDAFKAAGIQAWLFLWTGALLSFMAGLLVMGVAPWIFVLNNLIFLAGMTLHLRALIVRPLKEALRMSQRLAAGDLEYRADFEARGEFSELLHSLNVMQGTLHTMVSDVSAKAKSVGDASTGIANGITSLSQRTEAQASSLEETASSMEELTSTVRENADNAVQASRLMEETRSSAQAGGEVVTRAVEAMSEIDAASKRIAEISTVIDEIAFQTNLLALNAAVEAARAGEQGRGFAVVAGEVRNLAQRSAASAREIKDLIQDTVSKVENGRRLVNESGQTLTQIVSSVSKVNNVISDIAGASREQAAGIDQVNNAVMQMDQITQHNARLVDDAARASQLVADESEALVDVAAFFRRGGEVDHRVAPQPKPKSAAATGHAAAGAGPRVRSAAGGSRRRVA